MENFKIELDKKKDVVDRYISIKTEGAASIQLPRRYEKMSPQERAQALYDLIMTLKLAGNEENDESQQLIKSYVRSLNADKQTSEIFKTHFAKAVIEQKNLSKSDLFKNAKNLEKEIEELGQKYNELEKKLFIGEIKTITGRKIEKENLADLATELIEKKVTQNALINLESVDHIKENTDIAANQMYETLGRYNKEAKSGFAWLPSRHQIHKKIMAALANGRFPLLVGEPGTGKSEQADAIAKELTGSECVKVPCTSTTGETDLLFEKDIENGTSYLKYGAVPKAFTGYESSLDTKPRYNHGRILRLDEFLKINFNKTRTYKHGGKII